MKIATRVMAIITIVWGFLWFLVAIANSYDGETVLGAFVLSALPALALCILGIIGVKEGK